MHAVGIIIEITRISTNACQVRDDTPTVQTMHHRTENLLLI